MKLSIIAAVTLLAPLWFIIPAKAYSPQDLEQLRETGNCPRCDLSEAPLENFKFVGANLRDANLNQASMSQVNLSRADLSGANLEAANLTGATLTGASLTGANLKSAILDNADLTNAGLIAANLEAASLRSAKMDTTNLRGAKFRLTTMPNGAVTPDLRYW